MDTDVEFDLVRLVPGGTPVVISQTPDIYPLVAQPLADGGTEWVPVMLNPGESWLQAAATEARGEARAETAARQAATAAAAAT